MKGFTESTRLLLIKPLELFRMKYHIGDFFVLVLSTIKGKVTAVMNFSRVTSHKAVEASFFLVHKLILMSRHLY